MRSCGLTVHSARAKALSYEEVRFTRLKPGENEKTHFSIRALLSLSPRLRLFALLLFHEFLSIPFNPPFEIRSGFFQLVAV